MIERHSWSAGVASQCFEGHAVTVRDTVSFHGAWLRFDDEGRYIETRFGDLSVISLYLPSGSAGS